MHSWDSFFKVKKVKLLTFYIWTLYPLEKAFSKADNFHLLIKTFASII